MNAIRIIDGRRSEDSALRAETPPNAERERVESLARATPRLIVVSGVHSGAGASTVALAVAEAAHALGVTVAVDEFAGPFASGLGTACDAELGADISGRWLVGRRGGFTVRRLADSGATIANAAPPVRRSSHADDRRHGLVVAGCVDPRRRVCCGDWSAGGAADRAAGAGVPGHACPHCAAPKRSSPKRPSTSVQVMLPALAVLGPDRWPGEVLASIGPRVRLLRDQHRVVAVPLDKRLAVRGVTADPLPRSVTAAGRSLLQLFTPAPARTSREGDS